MKTYAYQNGITEFEKNNAKNPDQFTHRAGTIDTIDGRSFFAKARSIYRTTSPQGEPHLEEVTAIFPNGRTAQYVANLNNGIATFIKFND